MKRLYALIPVLLLAGCMTYPYDVRDGGDGVYYADSPPTYSYVDLHFGFPYYGPYAWWWYDPVWYAPFANSHYSWYRPRDYWCHPFNGADTRVAQTRVPNADRVAGPRRSKTAPDLSPSLSPLDLRQATIAQRQSYKRNYYDSPRMKQRMASKSYASTKPAQRSSKPSLRAPKSPSMTSRSVPRSASPPRSHRSVTRPSRPPTKEGVRHH